MLVLKKKIIVVNNNQRADNTAITDSIRQVMKLNRHRDITRLKPYLISPNTKQSTCMIWPFGA